MPHSLGESSKGKPVVASSNWLALKKTLKKKSTRNLEPSDAGPRKRRKLEHSASLSPEPTRTPRASQLIPTPRAAPITNEEDVRNGESLSALRRMIFGQIEYTANQQLPGKYLALDCEMVGVGIDGAESSLARVSLVNFYGAVQLDEFVRQRERVVDYRTQYSGVRESDMVKAKPFEEVQKRVADMLKDRILVGHAVYNDLKALLLTHPRNMTRDTQVYAGKHKVVKSKFVALRNLVKQELNVTIQSGEHSSVTDARATMAIYRLHRKEWEKGNKPLMTRKRKRADKSPDEAGEASEKEDEALTASSTTPGGGRKGVSSGLTTVVRHGSAVEKKTKWWKEELKGEAKGSIKWTADQS
ncbi:putative EXOIII [Lyophyllum shimeji]|uniref:RNA exonuclease 4 n=1 Tax=Lyophyllum shimeji TaxID=47721 RepID=A0A9P3PKJ0_LYOSH|nr:putative EXOIII [Lyophyllum shimeji]